MRSFQPGEIIAGKYRLQSPLARGGMGSLWTAWNHQLDVPVAVKFMSPDALASAELVARFEREAKAAAQMRIPQVVQVFEHGVHSGVPFMAMELLEGEDLGKRLRARGRLSLGETAHIVGEVCKALRRAHELGIVHRDLKPANVFLARSGDEEVVKVLDFGIAKVLSDASGSEPTRTGALIGTPHYMSPEQARRTSRGVDHRSDLWSLGVIAFRAITGKLPFAGDDPIDVLVRICTEAAPAASSAAPDVGPAVDRFFARALAFDPEARFQSARELAGALNTILGVPFTRRSSPGLPEPASGDPARGAQAESLDAATVPIHHAPSAGRPALAPSYPPSAPGLQGAPPAISGATPAVLASPATGESAGTLTTAPAEVPPPREERRSSLLFLTLGASALLILVVVGSFVATGLSSSNGPALAAPPVKTAAPAASSTATLASIAASTLDAEPAQPPAPASVSASAPAVASADPAPKTAASADPTGSAAPAASVKLPPVKPQGTPHKGSAIFGDPVFRP